jgi:hypothetical protein
MAMMTTSMVGTALALLLGLFAVTELGYRIGRRHVRATGEERGSVGAVQGAVLGLLGLLLGFNFSGAAHRLVERQDMMVSEANAISTAYLRMDLLEEPHRTRARDILRRYVDLRILLQRELDESRFAAGLAECEELQTKLWNEVVPAVKVSPSAVLVLPAVNQVIDDHALRLASGRRHAPMPVMILLVISALISLGMVGYGAGISGAKRNLSVTGPLILLIAMAFWVTIDMEYPRHGLMQLNLQSMLDLQRSMR